MQGLFMLCSLLLAVKMSFTQSTGIPRCMTSYMSLKESSRSIGFSTFYTRKHLGTSLSKQEADKKWQIRANPNKRREGQGCIKYAREAILSGGDNSNLHQNQLLQKSTHKREGKDTYSQPIPVNPARKCSYSVPQIREISVPIDIHHVGMHHVSMKSQALI